MKLKILLIMIIAFFLTSSTLIASTFQNEIQNTKINSTKETNIRIAMYSNIPIGWDKDATEPYVTILKDYEWTVGNKTYRFELTPIFDGDILVGRLNIDNYDALLVSGGGVGDENSITKGFFSKIRPKIIKWKKNILDFIKNGGGYIGYCGGSALMCKLGKKPESFLEHAYDKSSIGASNVLVYWKAEGPSKFLEAWSCFTNETYGYPDYNGLCFDVPLNKKHPIHDDFIGDTCRVRWIGGPSFIIPKNISSNATILGTYPKGKISENNETRLRIWKYTGGIIGLVKGYFQALKWLKKNDMPLSDALVASIDFRTDWELTDEYITLNYSKRPCMVAEIYPNKNKGRIILNSFHPERNVWWGGHFEEFSDTDNNYVADGFYKLTDYVPFDETPEDEWTHTWWMIKREIAFAAKVLDKDLPPIYGPSQVCDFDKNITETDFKVKGNSESAEGIVSLDLYYRYSEDNESWTDWTLFDTDNDKLDGWSWEFNSPNGTGYYQFYSIRNLQNGGTIETEKNPPGADASIYIQTD